MRWRIELKNDDAILGARCCSILKMSRQDPSIEKKTFLRNQNYIFITNTDILLLLIILQKCAPTFKSSLFIRLKPELTAIKKNRTNEYKAKSNKNKNPEIAQSIDTQTASIYSRRLV